MRTCRLFFAATVAGLVGMAAGGEARAQSGRVLDFGRPGGRVMIDPGRPGGRLIPGYDPGRPGGRVVSGQPGTYPMGSRSRYGRGRWYPPPRYGPPLYGPPVVVQRYLIPSGYVGVSPGYVINYGGVNYISNADGTMSPYAF